MLLHPRTLYPAIIALLLLAAAPLRLHAQQEESVDIQFPHAPVDAVLSYYEMLTGKRTIRDSKLGGDDIYIVADKVPKSAAIRMIEAAFLLNGYSLVPVDKDTIKILGPQKTARSEAIPLIASAENLPAGEELVSYFMPLRYLSPQDASTIFSRYIKASGYSSIIPLANVSAIVITDKTSVIRTMINLQALIDKPATQLSRHFVLLKRANSEKVVATLEKMFSTKKDNAGPQAAAAPGSEGGNDVAASALIADANASESLRFIADERTNRVIVVCRDELFPQVSGIIEELDASVDLEKPLEHPLKYVKAAEVLPVLAKLIAESKEDIEEASNAAQAQPNSQQNLVQNNSGGNNGSGFQNASYSGGSSNGTPDLSNLTGGGNSLNNPQDSPAPQCIIVGKTRIIADSSSNAIIIIGPPESRDKADHILNLLDHKPLQIYLSTLIGELRMDNGMDYGFNYVLKFNQLQGGGSGIGGLMRGGALGTDLLPDPSQALSSAATQATTAATTAITNGVLPSLSGLTIFGSIADSVDIFAHFLETNARFKTLSRPVLYTTNNKKAVILSGQEVPVPQQTLTSTTPGGTPLNNSAITANITYMPVVLKLEVVPLINSNNEVTLVITQQNNTIQGNTVVAGQQAPIINTQQITTTVTVPSGQTVVLGGLTSEDKSDDKTGLPYISRVPVLGALFGTTSKSKVRKELIVMIQPVIVGDNATLAKASDAEVTRPEIGEEVYQRSFASPTPSPTPAKKKKHWP